MILRGVKFAFKLLRDLVEEFGRDRRLYLRGRHFTILPACHMPSASIPDLEGRETGYEQDGANPPWSRERAFDRLWRLIPSLTAAGNAAAPQIENRSRYTSCREIPIFSRDQRTTKAPVIPRRMSAPVPNPSSPAILPTDPSGQCCAK